MTFAIGARRLRDYAEWKQAFDQGAEMRKQAGMKSYRIFQTVDDPNQIVVMVEFADPAAARKFMNSAALREADEMSGVIERPDTFDTSNLLVEAESGTCD
jgi:quinol monooxygenase YgiN